MEIEDIRNKIGNILNSDEKNYIEFERTKNPLFSNFVPENFDPERHKLWVQRVDKENQRSLSLPYEMARQYAHAAIFSLVPQLLRSAILNHMVTSKEAELINSMPEYRSLRPRDTQSMQELLRQIRNNADAKAKRHGANQFRFTDDKFYSNHQFCPKIWEQMAIVFSQPNHQGVLDGLCHASRDDVIPEQVKMIEKMRELRVSHSLPVEKKIQGLYLSMKKSRLL